MMMTTKVMVMALAFFTACTDARTPFEFRSSASGTRNTGPLDSVMFEGRGPFVDDMYPDFSDARGATYRLTVTRDAMSATVDVMIGDECDLIAGKHDIGPLTSENQNIAFDNSLAMDLLDTSVICVGTQGSAENGSD
jgi:hypothetical protein